MQNAEQSADTVWSRVFNRSNSRPTDELYKLHSAGIFDVLEVTKTIDPELFNFVEETKTKGPRFSNYSKEKLENFVSRIYELRKNNLNNPT